MTSWEVGVGISGVRVSFVRGFVFGTPGYLDCFVWGFVFGTPEQIILGRWPSWNAPASHRRPATHWLNASPFAMLASFAFAEKTGSVSRAAVRWRRWSRQRVEEAVEHVGAGVGHRSTSTQERRREVATEKVVRILRSKTELSDEEIEALSDAEAWQARSQPEPSTAKGEAEEPDLLHWLLSV